MFDQDRKAAERSGIRSRGVYKARRPGDDSVEDAVNGLRTTVDGSISVPIEHAASLAH